MRHKGLGEFDPDELEVILFHEARYIVVTKELIEEMKGQENDTFKKRISICFKILQ